MEKKKIILLRINLNLKWKYFFFANSFDNEKKKMKFEN
jgi:hypothetical protein